MKKIDDDGRPFLTKLYYYFMIIAGPTTVFISSGAVTYTAYNIAISPLFTTSIVTNFFAFLLAFAVFSSWFLGNSILIYSAIIDPGSTRYIINSQYYQKKYSMYLSSEFLSRLPKCEKCGLPKPPRCHHCSTCGKCHLKLDHHCVIIGKCVSLRNQQPFYVACHWATLSLFIDIIILTSIFFFSIILKAISNKKVETNFDSKISFIDSFLIKGSSELTTLFIFDILVVFLFWMFYSFISDSYRKVKQNTTTFELIFPTKNQNWNPYDLGEEDNIYQVYGDDKLRLFWPKITDMCGFEWATPEYAIQNFNLYSYDSNNRNEIELSNEQEHESVLFEPV